MQCKSILQIFTLIWCLNIKVSSIYAAQNLNKTSYLLTRMLAVANCADNFLIAPQEIIKLYENLNNNDYENTKDEEENHIGKEEDEEGYFSEKQRSAFPIIVTNILHAENDEKVNDFRKYIRNKTDTMQSPHSPTSLSATTTTSDQHKRLQLINTITLKSRWPFNFQKRDTLKHLFHTTTKSHVYVDSMVKDDMFPYALLEHLNATALELTLHQHHYDELKMLILLPNDVEGLPELQRQLCRNLSLIDEIVEQHLRPTFVRIFMPKFKITFNIELGQVFEELANTSLTHTVVLNSNISSIFQKTHIELNEDGIGDLERRLVLFWNAYSSLRTTPVFFDINRPFIFIIRNKKGIQFFGHLVEF